MSFGEMFCAGYISEHDTATHRVCGTCRELKPVDAFYKDGKDRSGNVRYRRDCRDCYKKQRLYEAKMKNRKKDNV